MLLYKTFLPILFRPVFTPHTNFPVQFADRNSFEKFRNFSHFMKLLYMWIRKLRNKVHCIGRYTVLWCYGREKYNNGIAITVTKNFSTMYPLLLAIAFCFQ